MELIMRIKIRNVGVMNAGNGILIGSLNIERVGGPKGGSR